MKLCYTALERKSTLALLWSLSEGTTFSIMDGWTSGIITLSIGMVRYMSGGLLTYRAHTATATTHTLSGLHTLVVSMMTGEVATLVLANRRRLS